MTNRELIQTAMPLSSLTERQWEALIKHVQDINGVLHEALETLISNQSRLEIISNYSDYYGDTLNNQIGEKSFPLEIN